MIMEGDDHAAARALAEAPAPDGEAHDRRAYRVDGPYDCFRVRVERDCIGIHVPTVRRARVLSPARRARILRVGTPPKRLATRVGWTTVPRP